MRAGCRALEPSSCLLHCQMDSWVCPASGVTHCDTKAANLAFPQQFSSSHVICRTLALGDWPTPTFASGISALHADIVCCWWHRFAQMGTRYTWALIQSQLMFRHS